MFLNLWWIFFNFNWVNSVEKSVIYVVRDSLKKFDSDFFVYNVIILRLLVMVVK